MGMMNIFSLIKLKRFKKNNISLILCFIFNWTETIGPLTGAAAQGHVVETILVVSTKSLKIIIFNIFTIPHTNFFTDD